MSLRQQSLRSKYFTKKSSQDPSVTYEGNNGGEDVEADEDDSSIDETYISTTAKRSNKRRPSKGIFGIIVAFKNYILIVVVIILGISYLHERNVRLQAVAAFNNKLSEKSFQDLYKSSSQKLASPGIVCPKCPECSHDDTPEISEKEEGVLEADPLEHVRKWDDKHKILTSEIQRLSRSLLQLKFGDPPYYVEFELEVDDENVKGGKITVEMAPIEELPYSVYFFLTQVSAGVWNSCRSTATCHRSDCLLINFVCSFFINLGVVYYDEARGSDRCKKEDFATVEGIGEFLAFQEYSHNYLHLPDTMGINGRPAGKGIYFNAQVRDKTYLLLLPASRTINAKLTGTLVLEQHEDAAAPRGTAPRCTPFGRRPLYRAYSTGNGLLPRNKKA